MKESSVRVLVVDDFEQWRRVVRTALQAKLGLQFFEEAADGLEAVAKAQDLQPELVVLDIGLPTLNGIEAARRIRSVSPKSKILFLTEDRSSDVAEAAIQEGASGYLLKSASASELIPAVQAVLEGRLFLSAKLANLTIQPELA
jgi:DNA-binding NarL/FixJ family response regulator